MDTNEDKEKQAESRCDSSSPDCGVDCCSPSSGGAGASWKTVVFVVVILLAGAVAAHSLLTRNNETTSVSADATSSFGTISSSDKAGLSTELSTASKQPSETVTVSCGVTVDSFGSLAEIADEKGADVVFVFLPGENEQLDQTASAQVEATMNMLSAKGKQVAAFTLQKDSEGYAQMIEQFSVQSLPSVVVAGKGCGAAAVSGEITETELLRAFVVASTPISCGIQCGSSCCP